MTKILLTILLASICIALREGNCQSNVEINKKLAAATMPYFGLKPPEGSAAIFADGIVSTNDYVETFCLFWDNGKSCLFQRIQGADNGIFITKLENGSWTRLKKVNLFGDGDVFEPGITPDGSKIYFNSFRPIPEGAKKGITWMIEKNQNGWTKPKYCEYGGMFPSIDKFGNIYTSTRQQGNSIIVRFKPANGVYDKMEILPEPVYSAYQDRHASVSPDGSYVIFDSGDRDGLFITFQLNDNRWSNPINLTNHLSIADGALARISSDGKYLFFQYEGAIYWASTESFDALKP